MASGRDFCEEVDSPFPPVGGGHCPLCLQEIQGDTADRLAHFEQHVQSAVQEQARVARVALASALEPLDEKHVADCRTPFLAGLQEREEDLHRAVESYLQAVASRMRALREAPAGANVSPLQSHAADRLDDWGRARSAAAETLLAADDPDREHSSALNC